VKPVTDCIHSVLLDLDGTLADTAPDLALALNALRAEHSYSPLPFDQIRCRVSEGSRALVQLAFGLDHTNPTFEQLRMRFLEIYRANLARETCLFPGMATVLDTLEAWGMSWGIVTNKSAWLTEPLLQALGLAERATCVVCGDTTANRKPHPEPLLLAAHSSRCHPTQCLYVGDSKLDIAAGRSAGMVTLVALFGYIDPTDEPRQWGADGTVIHPTEILEWLAQSRYGSR
jgi:2-phosphoglycolate phosphatase